MDATTTKCWKNLKIIFWNARDIKIKITEIQKILSETDILICVESLLKDDETVESNGFKTIYKNIDNSISGRGIVVFIRNGLNFIENIQFASVPKRIELLFYGALALIIT